MLHPVAGLAILFLFGLAACQKTPTPEKISLTPLQTLVNTDTSLSLFHRMILQANETVLLADDSVTLLIPTNAAFRQEGYSETTIDSLSATFADRLLRYEYIKGRAVPDSPTYTAYPTLLGESIYGMRDNNHHILFNSVQTTGDATPVGKAFVYRLNAPVQSAADSLSYLLQGDSTLSFLAEALYRTNLYDSVLLSGSYTLLAPVNSAWQQAGYDSLGAIDSANINVLFQQLKSQVLRGLWFTNSLTAQQVIPNLSGGSVTVSLSGPGGWQFSGAGNTVPANWLSGNGISGSALVVHRIDAMISP
jgi:uncharacterized surface protein with fasciclin (FAS1) repeats